MTMPVANLVCVADVVLAGWQDVLIIVAFALGLIGAGFVIILAGRSGMKSKDIGPSWRTGYTIWFYGGWWFVAVGILFLLAPIALTLISATR